MLDLSAKVQLWRQKAKEGALSHEEMREAISALRAGRMAASAGNDKKRETAKKPQISSDDLLKQLEGL